MTSFHNTLFCSQRIYSRLLQLLVTGVAVLILVSCHNDGLSRDQRQVRSAAERCYELLQEKKYDQFVEEIAYSDQMSPEYRQQMQDLIQEHADNMLREHGKLLSAEATGDSIIGDIAHVYLQVTYADSTSEEVGVPMICIEGKWKMQ